MTRAARSVVAAALLAAAGSAWLSGCAREPVLARGRFRVEATPSLISFERAASLRASGWELCLEFDKPGDSRHADAIGAVLLTAGGARRALLVERLDRRGESRVALLGRLADAAGADVADTLGVGVELVSSRPLLVRSVAGGRRD